MQFAVGYQLFEDRDLSFAGMVEDFRGRISEVYFPWLDMASGRMALTNRRGFVDWDGQMRVEEELRAIKRLGVRLNLLLNANCYGGLGISRYLSNQVCSLVDYLRDGGCLDAVTTASPMIAWTMKKNFPDIETRASVNMRVGTVKAMEYLASSFDGFHIQREYNRDFERIGEMKQWADARGKTLHLLVNSGCLNFCTAQTFHDNLVAHETEVNEVEAVEEWNLNACRSYYADRGHWPAFLQGSWIRPEDISRYESFFSEVKLATRMHANPRMVIKAYCDGKFSGNLPDLLEPGHAHLFRPHIIDNTRFPEDWFDTVAGCDKRCHRCSYCADVLEQVLAVPAE
jgi:collagenase-like PrtC family protease